MHLRTAMNGGVPTLMLTTSGVALTRRIPVPAMRVDLSGEARCIDGSPAVYYFSRGASKGVYIYHQ